jgi:bacteriocin-like protein
MHQLLMGKVIMGKLDAEQKPDMEDREELTERELNEVSGGDGPPGTAGDGNGRVYLRSQMR